MRLSWPDEATYALTRSFGSLLAILLLIVLFPARYTRGADFVVSLLIYAVAKAFEAADHQVFRVGGIVSGHTLTHLAAAISAYWILHILRHRERTQLARNRVGPAAC